ncbi:MAG: hypothetical protein AB1757_29345 [Acidobacteriota bacterium]
MRRKKLAFLVIILLMGMVLPGLLPPFTQTKAWASTTRLMADPLLPKISKATMVKKLLTVEGENFVEGTILLVNGVKVKSYLDEVTPTTKLKVNKANKRLPIDEIVKLQARNPDGQVSGEFAFFTGLTFSTQNTINGLPAFVQVGRKFLIYFNDENTAWNVHIPPNEIYVEFVVSTQGIWPRSQDIFLAKQPGYAPFWMKAFPVGQAHYLYLVNLQVVE